MCILDTIYWCRESLVYDINKFVVLPASLNVATLKEHQGGREIWILAKEERQRTGPGKFPVKLQLVWPNTVSNASDRVRWEESLGK